MMSFVVVFFAFAVLLLFGIMATAAVSIFRAARRGHDHRPVRPGRPHGHGSSHHYGHTSSGSASSAGYVDAGSPSGYSGSGNSPDSGRGWGSSDSGGGWGSSDSGGGWGSSDSGFGGGGDSGGGGGGGGGGGD